MNRESHVFVDHRSGRGNILRSFRASDRIPMPISPVEGVHRLESGKDAEAIKLWNLIFSGELAMNHDGPMITEFPLAAYFSNYPNQLVDGSIAIRMHEHLPLVVVGGAHQLEGFFLLEGGISGVALRLAGGWFEVGLGKPRRLPLRGAVEGEFDPSET